MVPVIQITPVDDQDEEMVKFLVYNVYNYIGNIEETNSLVNRVYIMFFSLP